MAAHERIDLEASIASSTLLQHLATVLPKDINFKIYHLSTPPSRVSALYHAPSGTRPDRTYCESHFLTASIQTTAPGTSSEAVDVLIFAIEVLIYSTAYDTTLFVSKADSTGFLHLLNLPEGTPSPLRDISSAFLRFLVERRQRGNIRSVVSLFARAQDQYLFPGSVEYSGKHVLDDRGLVRWWCRVLNPLIEDGKMLAEKSQWESVKGYLVVPGLDNHETLSYIPKTAKSQWTIGHPLHEISRHPSDVPPRCLIPHFPDDPKARYLDELDDEISKGQSGESGQWRSVKTLDQFWEMMAYRQECSAGRMVGFIWIVFSPSTLFVPTDSFLGDSQSTIATADSEHWNITSPSQTTQSSLALPITPSTSFNASSQPRIISSPLKPEHTDNPQASQQSVHSSAPQTPKKRKLTGQIVARKPRVKTHNKNYLLEKPENTAYYTWHPEGRGQVIVDETDYKRVTELLLRLDFENLEKVASSSTRWIHEVRSGASGEMQDAWGQAITGKRVAEVQNAAGTAGVNTLNMGLVRKKRKADSGVAEEPPISNTPTVNVLATSMIRKKAKV